MKDLKQDSQTRLQMTSLSPEQAAKVLAQAYGKRVEAKQIKAIAKAGRLLRADGTFSLIEYVAYLAQETGNG